jgi:dTDP-4-dehydrorhamnose reductase
MRVLVTGATGHLGTAIVEHFSRSHEVTATTRDDLDARDHRAVDALVRHIRPGAIINCAAYTDVDGAEDDSAEALNVNAFAVGALARAANDVGAALVHYSTDFVFDGTGTRPYTEEDEPTPQGTYACSKLIGEWLAQDADRAYVLRVESIFGADTPDQARRTSVDRIVDDLIAGRDARVFSDRTVSPSYGCDVALATRLLLERGAPAGLYHCVNTGACTWEALAREVARQLGIAPRLVPMRMSEARLRAPRPLYCALANAKLAAAGVPMPTWQDAIGRYLAAREGDRRGRA